MCCSFLPAVVMYLLLDVAAAQRCMHPHLTEYARLQQAPCCQAAVLVRPGQAVRMCGRAGQLLPALPLDAGRGPHARRLGQAVQCWVCTTLRGMP